jgi:hypothetical protein
MELLAGSENLTQRLMHFQSAIVIYISLPPELIHEEIDSWARGANHFGQNLVIYKWNLDNRWASFIQVREPQEYARQTLLGRRSQ